MSGSRLRYCWKQLFHSKPRSSEKLGRGPRHRGWTERHRASSPASVPMPSAPDAIVPLPCLVIPLIPSKIWFSVLLHPNTGYLLWGGVPKRKPSPSRPHHTSGSHSFIPHYSVPGSGCASSCIISFNPPASTGGIIIILTSPVAKGNIFPGLPQDLNPGLGDLRL